jgi:murein DD-endopeptidase MepM/ murein hydrolase activator NlpD
MSKPRRTLVLIRRGDRELRRVPVSGRAVGAFFGGLGLALLAATAIGMFSVSRRGADREITRLQSENESLRRTNVDFEARLGELQGRLAETEDRARQLSLVAGLGDLGGLGEPGTGGPLRAAAADAALAALEQRTQRVAHELDRAGERIEENLRRLSATPSIWPVAGLLTSDFGWRRDPLTGQRAFHSGIDISAAPGRPIVAAASGVVAKTEQYGGLGRAVYLSHGFGRTTVYGHMSRILVVPGQRIQRGETVGLVGNTGRSTGYHLHYEVQLDGDAVNPLPFLLDEPRIGS